MPQVPAMRGRATGGGLTRCATASLLVRMRWLAIVLVAGCGGTAPPAEAADTSESDASSTTDRDPSSTSGAAATSGSSTSSTADTSSSDASSSDASSSSGGVDLECSISGTKGMCGDVTACADPSVSVLGTCDDVPSIQCCLPDVILCSVDAAPGVCLPSAECPRGLDLTSGLCPGDADIQCCTDPALACDPDAAPTPNARLVESSYDPSCPDGMITAGDVCVDRHEASLVVIDDGGRVIGSHSPYVHPSTTVRAVSIEGAVPQGYIDADTAQAACAAANKRLCTDAEWLRACRGASDHLYPYGDRPLPGTCNDARANHPAIEYLGTADPSVFSMLGHPCILQVPNGIQTTGAHPQCVTEDGAFDMMGNLHEWTADPAGTFRGGFFVDTVLNGPGCTYATTAHDRSHWDYSTGFRCCADPL